MARNKQTGHKIYIPLRDGKKKLIRLGTNEFADIEDQLGIKNILGIFRNMDDGEASLERFGFGALRAFCWAGLNGALPEGATGYTVRQVGDLLDTTRLGEYWTAIGQCLRLCIAGDLETTAEQVESGEGLADSDDLDPTE